MSQLPKVDPANLCNTLQLCSLRTDESNHQYVAVQPMHEPVQDFLAKDIVHLDRYLGKEIQRIYSSGHVLLSDDCDQIYLVQTTKRGKTQWQLTGGSPKEDSLKQAIRIVEGEVQFDLQMIEFNAETRTQARLGIAVTDTYNNFPTIDRVLQETQDKESGESYRRLICLMHYRIKSYTGELLPQIGTEHVTGGRRFAYEELQTLENIAPNVLVIMNYFRSLS